MVEKRYRGLVRLSLHPNILHFIICYLNEKNDFRPRNSQNTKHSQKWETRNGRIVYAYRIYLNLEGNQIDDDKNR